MEPPRGLSARFSNLNVHGGLFSSAPLYQTSSNQGATDQTQNVEALLARKLANSALPLDSDQSIALLTHCIALGNIEAKKAKNTMLTVCIGNTGSGKSTFVNYLFGCTMQRVPSSKLGLAAGLGKVFIVKPIKEGGALDEIVRIGHTTQSMTFMPQIIDLEEKSDLTLCDCPGFLDNRGSEINIANAVNIHKTLICASSIRVVILINYHTIKSAKGRGLSEMVQICCSLFGSKENLLSCKGSILFGMTHIPRAEVQDDDDEESPQQTLEVLKNEILGVQLSEPFEREVVAMLVESLFIYDPIDNANLRFKGALKRTAILEALSNLTPIENPADIFKTVLTPTDKQGLVSITDAILRKIQQILQKQNVAFIDFQTVAQHLKSLKRLEIIENAHVARLLASARIMVIQHFDERVHQFDICMHSDRIPEATKILKSIKLGLLKFGSEIQLSRSVKDLKVQLKNRVKRQEALEKVRHLADLEKELRDCCARKNFKRAKEILGILEEQINKFDGDYSETGIQHNIDIDPLQELYKKAKDIHNNDILRVEEEQNKKEAALRKRAEEQKQLERQAAAQREKDARERQEMHARQAKKDAEEAQERRRREVEATARHRADEAAALRRAEQAHRERQNASTNKLDLRNDLLGFGPAFPVMTYLGLQLRTSSNQFHPIVWTNGAFGNVGDRIVIDTILGYFMIGPDGATKVMMTFEGPVPLD